MNNKSRVLNIAIIVLALALIIFLVVKEKKSDTDENPINETPSETDNNGAGANNGGAIPVPSEASWGETETETKTKLTFEAPEDYYISYPVIGGCDEVVSISTQTPTDPTIAVALIYKDGCVTDVDVTGFYAHREVKNGYVFQTNSTHPTVMAVFNRIVATAEVNN